LTPREDLHHLNAISWSDGQLLVSGFGKRSGPTWDSANEGFIYNVTRAETVASGIDQPHSVVEMSGSITYCESRKMALRSQGDKRTQILPGYSRGLCRIGRHLFVATSLGRRVSRSTARVIGNPADLGELEGRCTISRLTVDGFAIEATTDLTAYASEIYDLLPVEGTNDWPVMDEVIWRDSAIIALARELDLQRTRAKDFARRAASASAAESAQLGSPDSP
jgi:hypothetical protein